MINLSNLRTIFYSLAKYLGDFSAVKRAIETKSLRPIITRLLRRLYGKVSSRGFNFFK